MKNAFLSLLFLCTTLICFGQRTENEKDKTVDASLVSSLKFRMVGPALASGRISDIAVTPENPNVWYISTASGGVWKTENHGTTFSPIFDSYGSYSAACVELAPSNSNTVWIGTGENNNQRSVAYGDGVYKSINGGTSFKNMGLKESEHIGNIIIHPTNENIVWVAAYGPVWSAGGERGVYMTTDGGENWKRTLEISEHTGISEIAIDPTNPQTLYAAAHQRRRREWTYISGGPESGMYKSIDGGLTWKEINVGLPEGQMGRIGIAVSPVDPNYVYAIAEARDGKNGFFRSTNKGESWEKRSSYSTSGNYYQEIMCDLTDKDKIFSMNTYLHHSTDGGKNFVRTGESKKHVDNHAIWINPSDPNHWIVGCDGGLYETYNHAEEWKFYSNLPLTQFYKVSTDNDKPFYNIYGGTQDNNTLGGPSATNNTAGIRNSDWFYTNGGDGFEAVIDPLNPNIVYAQSQYGYLVRFDKASGERISIQPLPGKGEAAFRWNWDAPILISPHDNKTLYFAANKVFKTTNRGDDWSTISPDLSQQIDRNKLEVMGQVWSIDAVMKNKSTSIYGNIIALDESPIQKGLLYAGTDDGLIQISKDDGASWTKISSFPDVPKNTRVNMLVADLHDANVVYAVFNNHRSGDFAPYVYKSTDQGKTWKSISSNLPERGSAYCIKQDHKNSNLLFAGTDFGAYFSNDGGANWAKLAGLPTIAVLDLDIQKRENDLVAATFGRGFYVLDNYTPLRDLKKEHLEKDAHLFPVKDALLYAKASPLLGGGVGSLGAGFWHAENPKYGAIFTLHLKSVEKSLKSKRQNITKEQEKNKEISDYPTFEDLKAEKLEDKAKLIWIIKDASGSEIRRMTSSPKKGISRFSWDLRTTSTSPVNEKKSYPGPMVTPGTYSVEVIRIKDGVITKLVAPTTFNVKSLDNQTLPTSNNAELATFRIEVAETSRKIDGSGRLLNESKEKIKLYESALINYPNTDINLLTEIETLKTLAYDCEVLIWGDRIKSSLDTETYPSISSRIGKVKWQLYSTTSGVTKTMRENKRIAEEEYAAFRIKLDDIIVRLKKIEKNLDDANIPYIKGKDEKWKEE